MNNMNVWLAQSNSSFLQGASHPHELVEEAAVAGYSGICISDFDGFYGLVKSWQAGKQCHNMGVYHASQLAFQLFENTKICDSFQNKVSTISEFGEPVFLQNRISFIATTKISYSKICALTSRCRAASKSATPLSLSEREHWPHDCVAILPQRGYQQLFSPHDKSLFRSWQDDIAKIKSTLGENLFLAVTPPSSPLERNAFENHMAIHKSLNIPLVATEDVFFHSASRKQLHDILTCIRFNQPRDKIPWAFFSNSERRFHKKESFSRFFKQSPTLEMALRNNAAIAERIQFSPTELRYRYPKEFLPENHTANSYLTYLVEESLQQKYESDIPHRLRELVTKELMLVRDLDFADYFLTVWDIVRFARSQHILCQGRGSAANSAVCFLLHITPVDPMISDVLFERFISKERGEPPDIDVDFEHERREEVIQYIYNRYGRTKAAMVANVITFRPKGAIRGAAKALGICEERAIAVLRKKEELKSTEDPSLFHQCQTIAKELEGFPRHLGIHSGGFVIGQEPLENLSPIEPATMPGRTVIQWNKDDIEALGFFKIDVLALGMLTALRKTFDILRTRNQRIPGTLIPINLESIPSSCEKTYAMIRAAKTTGVFQIESRAQMAILPKIKPREFYDLVVSIGIVRPGPIVSGMVRSYVNRKLGYERPEYPDSRLKPILQRTLGVPIFQEQVMRVAMAVANFSPGEADELRRAMGAWKLNGNMQQFESKLRDGMKKNNIPESFANIIFKQIEGFSQYGFPESHATSFAFLAYASAWLKAHFPADFLCGLLNSQPLGFYSPHSLLQEAKQAGVRIHNPCAFHSEWDSVVESGGCVRLGLRTISGIHENNAHHYLNRRRSIQNPSECISLLNCFSQAEHVRLAMAGCFDAIIPSRRDALWSLLAQGSFLWEEAQSFQFGMKSTSFENWDNMQDNLKHKGYTIDEHPITLLKKLAWPFDIETKKLISSQRLHSLQQNSRVTVTGLVTIKQRPPTAKGMMFITLEDETGTINLVVKPDVQIRYERQLSRSTILCCAGKKQSNGSHSTVLVDKVYDLLDFNSPSDKVHRQHVPKTLHSLAEPQPSSELFQTKSNQQQQKP